MSKSKQTLDVLYAQLQVVEDLIEPFKNQLIHADSITTPAFLINLTLLKRLVEKQINVKDLTVKSTSV